MNRRIFKKIASHKYIYPTKRIQNIIYHIDESGDTIMYYKKTCYKYWSFVLKRIEIRNKLLLKYFATRKYLMKVPSRTELSKQLHRMVTIRRTIKTEKLKNQINKRDYCLGLDIVKKNMDLYGTNYGVSCRISTPNYIVKEMNERKVFVKKYKMYPIMWDVVM